MLTAAGTVGERVDGLGLGADDYLPKPFDFAELVARIRALAPAPDRPRCRRCCTSGDLTLDPARRVATRAGRRLDLSPKEFAVLECLLAAGGRLVSAEELLERVWDEAADPFTTAVKTTIRRLRAKLGDPPVIHTVREAGYRIGDAVMPRPPAADPAHPALRRAVLRSRARCCVGDPGPADQRSTVRRPGRRPGAPRPSRPRPTSTGSLAASAIGLAVDGRWCRSCSAGCRRAGSCVRCGRSPRRPGTSPPATCTAGSARTGRDDEFTRARPRPSTTCSRGWRRRSSRSGTSSPTPRTSCAPR